MIAFKIKKIPKIFTPVHKKRMFIDGFVFPNGILFLTKKKIKKLVTLLAQKRNIRPQNKFLVQTNEYRYNKE